MNALAITIAINLHRLQEEESFTISQPNAFGEQEVLTVVTRADFQIVAEGNSLEDILSCQGDLDWVAYRLSQRYDY